MRPKAAKRAPAKRAKAAAPRPKPAPRAVAATRLDPRSNTKPGAPPVEDRVDVILGMMARGEYRGTMTVAGLAESWGVSARTVEAHAAEASRVVRREVDRDALTGHIIAALSRVMSVGEDRDVVKAADVLAKICELYTKKTATTIDLPPSQMTPEQARAALGEALAAGAAMLNKPPTTT